MTKNLFLYISNLNYSTALLGWQGEKRAVPSGRDLTPRAGLRRRLLDNDGFVCYHQSGLDFSERGGGVTEKRTRRKLLGALAALVILGESGIKPVKPVVPERIERPPVPAAVEVEPESVQVPILMYHHFSPEPASDVEIAPEVFAQHLEALSQAGYTAVLFRDLIDYVYDGGDLPEKPVCITIDDGYLSNYEIAWPLLEQYGMKATIFVIGSSIGHTEFYKDTEYPITPHFDWEQAKEMQASGIIDIQCHTYDMHQWPLYETGDEARASILRLEGESEEAYRAAVTEDLTTYNQLRMEEMGTGFSVLAYPGGGFDELSEEIVHVLGIPVTLTTQALGPNTVIRGEPASLYAMYRWNISNEVTGEQLLEMIQ